MEAYEKPKKISLKIASAAILTAVTVVMTIAVRIPVAPTRGYINLGDMAIYFTALSFGPLAAFTTGGLGTAIADIISGYPQWALFSFLIHGLQGLAVGFLYKALPQKSANITAFAAGTAIMAGGYFLTGSIMSGTGAALAEIPGNIVQNLAGIIGGNLLYTAVKKAYPPFANYRW